MIPDPKPPRDSRPPPRRDDSFRDLERLDRPELDDDEADWEKETGVRRLQKTKTPPTKVSGCA